MKIDSHDWPAKQIFKQGYFVIPRYQRPYSWDREQVEEFWEDTISEKPEQYFIGSMVFFGQSEEELAVVDGQQRLTTIVTTLCALRDVMESRELKDLADGIHNIIERKDVNNKMRYCLRTESSYPFFQKSILRKGKQKEKITAKEEEERLKLAYDYAIERITSDIERISKSSTTKKEKVEAEIEKYLINIRERILGLNLIFVVVGNEEDAYTIFETLNTRGKDLRTADLVKTHFARLLRQDNMDVDTVRDRWNDVMETFQSSEAGIDPDVFLLHWWLSRDEYTTQKKLYKKFKRAVTRTNADGLLDSLVEESARYRAIREPSYRKWTKDQQSARRALEGFRSLSVQQQLPMVVALIRELDTHGLPLKAVSETLRVIENFHFLGSAIAARHSSGGTSMMYASHARALFKAANRAKKQKELSELKKKLRKKLPNQEEVVAGFSEIGFSKVQTKQKRLVQYILEEIDLSLMPSRPPDFSRMTIEHIAPQAGQGISAKDVASLGNLILVPSELNNKLGSRSFGEKKALLIENKIPLDPVLTNASSWGAKEIEKRLNWMAKRAYTQIWAIR